VGTVALDFDGADGDCVPYVCACAPNAMPTVNSAAASAVLLNVDCDMTDSSCERNGLSGAADCQPDLTALQ
jgi:hypothetical protein